ncbi:MAG: ATP-binding cassette domain-containing protein [Gammaproteobacteria bacterium]|nr:ATP-binding cassette domain-containing protein [Gammaproteobacteria bacterium]
MSTPLPTPSAGPILKLDGLKTYFHTREGTVRAVDGVSLELARGETLCIVGESGCGKSVTALSILGLLPIPPACIESGSIEFLGENLVTASEARMREIRGNQISMIFQEPMTSLNPVMTIGAQISEAILLHRNMGKREARARVLELLQLVQIAEAQRRIDEYPHQMSGGMRQRIMIAMALACHPAVLIADEPTTALDVTIQAQILNLMLELKERLGTAIILITHDLGVVAETAQRVVVMYAGRKVEQAPVERLFEQPLHPYTRGLLRSIPSAHERISGGTDTALHEIAGVVPNLRDPIAGCAFAERCEWVQERCTRAYPELTELECGHWVACWRAGEGLGAASSGADP